MRLIISANGRESSKMVAAIKTFLRPVLVHASEDLVLHRIFYSARLADESEESTSALRTRPGEQQNAQNFDEKEGCVLAFVNHNQCRFFTLSVDDSRIVLMDDTSETERFYY